jgi:hypothetical protein
MRFIKIIFDTAESSPKPAAAFLLFGLLCLSSCASPGLGRLDLTPATDDKAQLEKLCGERVSGACALLGREALPTHTLPILQGLTSHQQARFVAHVPKLAALTYFVTGPKGIVKVPFNRQLMKGSGFALDQFEVFNLELGLTYELIVVGGDGTLWDRRKFSALDLGKKRAHFIIASCMDENWKDLQKTMWTQVLEHGADVIFLIGDNVYADLPTRITSAEQLMRRYSEAREGLELFRAPKLVPIMATWDDHDYGVNDGDRTWALKSAVTSTFFGFFPQEKPGAEFQRGPGVSSWWKAFGVNFALLDDRSFRSPDGLDLRDQTHFGAEQERWIQQGLKDAREPVLLMSGDQFFGEYKSCESYETNQPKSLKAQLAQWRKVKVPILFISGDRHLADINLVPKPVLGYPTYEITSSAIHARVYKDGFERCPSPHQVVGAAGEMNYMLVEIQNAKRTQLTLEVQSYGPDRKLQFQKKLTVKR